MRRTVAALPGHEVSGVQPPLKSALRYVVVAGCQRPVILPSSLFGGRGHRYSQHRTLGVFTTRFLCPFLDRQFSILLTVCLLIPIVSPISAGLFPCRSASITNRSRGDRMFITSAITAVVSRSRTCFRTTWRESVALKLCSVEVGSLSSEDHLGGSSRLFGNAIPGLMQADAR